VRDPGRELPAARRWLVLGVERWDGRVVVVGVIAMAAVLGYWQGLVWADSAIRWVASYEAQNPFRDLPWLVDRLQAVAIVALGGLVLTIPVGGVVAGAHVRRPRTTLAAVIGVTTGVIILGLALGSGPVEAHGFLADGAMVAVPIVVSMVAIGALIGSRIGRIGRRDDG
jgi:hypothetical protein